MNSLNLCNEERPASFDEMIGQKKIVKNIRVQSQKDRFFQCYILEGQYGSGKTTMARILTRAINCSHKDKDGNPCGKCPECQAVQHGSMDILEMDAASNTGVDSIRELKDSVSYLPVQLKKKVYIIDEVHKLSDSAFNALLKVLEEPPAHVVFVLCTTDALKIPATIRSRAACYHFSQISMSDIEEHLKCVSVKHEIPFEKEGLELIAKNAQGSMRNALKLLEQSAQTEDKVTKDAVTQMLGLTDPEELFQILRALAMQDAVKAVSLAKNQLSKGKNPVLMVSDMLSIAADLVVASISGTDAVENTEAYLKQVDNGIKGVLPSSFCAVTEGLMELSQKLRYSADGTTLVCGLIRITNSPDSKVAQLEKKVQELEDKIASGTVQMVSNEIEHNDRKLEEPDETYSPYGGGSIPQKEITKNVTNSKVPAGPSSPCVEKEPLSNDLDGFVNADDADIPFDTAESVPFEEEKVTEASSSKEKVPAAEQTSEEIDPFDLLTLFSLKVTSTEKEETNTGIEKEPEKESKIVPEKESEKETEIVPEKETSYSVNPDLSNFDVPKESFNEDEDVEVHTPEEVDEFLQAAYAEEPIFENLMEFGFQRGEENGKTVFSTSLEPFHKIAEAYREVKGKFPFIVRKK